jgi:hypothetical protein
MEARKGEYRKTSQTFYMPFWLREKMLTECKRLGISISEYLSLMIEKKLNTKANVKKESK